MTIAAGNRRPAWFRWVAGLPVVVALLFTSIPAAACPGPRQCSGKLRRSGPEAASCRGQHFDHAEYSRAPAGAGPRPGPEMPQFPPGSPFEEFFRDFFDRQGREQNAPPRRATSLGSGFVIDAGGLVVTNNHVIQDADEINVILQDDTNLKAELVGRDTKTDLALLRVKTDKKLTAVTFGNSDDMRVGDWVLAIGNPFGLGGTVTAGIISARARDINAGPVRRLPPDRRVDQPGQFRRPDVQHAGRGHRHQHRDLLAVRRLDRHRLRHPVDPGAQRRRAASGVRPDPARLARRAHPGGDARDRRKPGPDRPRPARWSPA